MTTTLIPRLHKITVSPNDLILDPNNPRFISKVEDRIEEQHIFDTSVIKRTLEKMTGNNDNFHIKELERSIIKNGWQPVDSIFVRRHGTQDKYIVLEGNRRVTAILNLLEDNKTASELRKDLSQIEVMEVLDTELSVQELEKRISYLLGVRHHGSLKPWSPFAQAHNMYLQYLKHAAQTDETFEWSEEAGKKIADALSIKLEVVKDRLKVYRAMQQIGNSNIVQLNKEDGGGMRDRYYSVFQEVLNNKHGKLREYIKQSQNSFELDDVSIERMENLCHFSKKGRTDAPINNPQQWRFLNNILSDDDEEQKNEMLRQVEVLKKRPDTVWALRAEELKKLQWDKWLSKVGIILGGVSMDNIQINDEEKEVIQKLANLLDELNRIAKDSVGEINA